MKLAIILGTRPEIIKMAPVIRACRERLDFILIHTNQHYSQEMDEIMFRELDLPKPHYNLNVGSGIHGLQTGRMLERIEQSIIEEKITMVLVHGDTNTTLAGGLAARKLNLKIGHVEAGLRSFDKTMPEEVNRVLTDHISDFCFAPTLEANNNLIREGIAHEKIFVVGNTIVDSVEQNKIIAQKKADGVFEKFNLERRKYFLLTYHRAENTENEEKIKNVLHAVSFLGLQHDIPVLFPIHPRTEAAISNYQIKIPDNIIVTKPLGYLEFLLLMSEAKLIITDSGGLQEEACILRVPCITLRENTERPETLKIGCNTLVGTEVQTILDGATLMLNQEIHWSNPFGDGHSAEKIIDILQ